MINTHAVGVNAPEPGYTPSSSWGPGGTPYKYGQVCKSVSVGGTRPDLGYKTESVYEDDECVCGPLDLA